MSWLLLALGSVSAILALNAFFPPRRPAVLAAVVFFAGWLTVEPALWHLLWWALLSGALVAGGGLDAVQGWVGLGLTGAACTGLTVAVWWSRRTGRVVEAALEEGLGADAAGDLTPQPRVRARELLLHWPLRPSGVERIFDIPYRQVGNLTLTLDVVRARERASLAPTLLWVHGGGWTISDKRYEGGPLMHHLAQQGWVCVTANYRLSPRATFPDALVDVKDALRWIRTEGAALGADPELVLIAGGSAGAHLAALAALTPNESRYQPGFEEVDTSVRGCVAIYGIYDLVDKPGDVPHSGMRRLLERAVLKATYAEDPALWEEASPLYRVHREAPPFFLFHGDRDTLSPVAGARRFVAALRRTSAAPCCYAELRGAQHAFEVFPSMRAAAVVRGVAQFAGWLRS